MVGDREEDSASQGPEEPPRERVVAVVETVARHLALQPWAEDLSTQEVAEALGLTPGDVSACLTWCEAQGLVTSSAEPRRTGVLLWRATRQGFAFLVEVIESEQAQS